MKRNVLRRFLDPLVEFVSHDPLALAASIAFYAALSFTLLIVISLWLATELLPGVEQSLIDQLGILLGSQVRESTLTIMENAGDSPIRASASGILSVVVLAISATTAFAPLLQLADRADRRRSHANTCGGIWRANKAASRN